MEDGFDEDIEFGDEVSDEGEGDPVDNVSIILQWFVSAVGLAIQFSIGNFTDPAQCFLC